MTDWIRVVDAIPEEDKYYLVYVHAPGDMDKDLFSQEDDNGKPVDWGYISLAYFNKRQGGFWEMEYTHEAYGTDLSKINLEECYYVSHWMPLPETPKE